MRVDPFQSRRSTLGSVRPVTRFGLLFDVAAANPLPIEPWRDTTSGTVLPDIPHVSFGNANAAQIGAQELER